MPDERFFNTISPVDLEFIAKQIDCDLHEGLGKERVISGVASLLEAGVEDVTFLSNAKYAESLTISKAGACVLHEANIHRAPEGMALIISHNPYYDFARIAKILHPNDSNDSVISPQAIIADSAIIAEGCSIGAGVIIEENAEIGTGTKIGAGSYIGKGVLIGASCNIASQATITHAIIGENTIIHPGVRIGQDGFGFAAEKGVHHKVPQLGRVIIEDNVEIGANSCIDRGAGPDTIIGAGTKIDNLVQIAHNVQMGKGCIIVSQVGIAGSTKLGDYVVVGGQVGIAGHLHIGSGVNIAAQSGVMRNADPKEILGGAPALPIREWHRQTTAIKRLSQRQKKREA